MNGTRLWLCLTTLQSLLLLAACAKPYRRSMPTQQSIPLSKGGWRPVVGSNGFLFGFGTAPLHAPAYKIPVPVLDSYPSSSRPVTARDVAKLTSIAQSYRPTTIRTIPAHPATSASQPINSYLNPYSLPANGLTHYKFVQNFPVESVVIRNPHNPYAARPIFSKYPTKFKQQYNTYQQLNTVQPIHFGQFPTVKPIDPQALRPQTQQQVDKKPQSSGIETFKPEVYKLPDSDTAPQSIHQQVKTAQQQTLVTPKIPIPVSPYPQYTYHDSLLPPNILGTFGSFGVQSLKGNQQLVPAKSTFIPAQPTKQTQTLFNSFSFAPNFKTTFQYQTTTPKLQTTANQIHYSTTWTDYKNQPTQAPKAVAPAVPAKIDPNVNKGNFKASPQDPFIKPYIDDYKVSTYNPTVQTTTFAYSSYHPVPQNIPVQNYYNTQQYTNTNKEQPKKKQQSKLQDSVPAYNQQTSHHYANPPVEGTQKTIPHRATYEVTEVNADDVITHSSPTWQATQESYKPTEEIVTKPEHPVRHSTTNLPDLQEEFAIVTEGDKGFENSLGYDSELESQSRRPLGDDFEPIGKHKLKDYYYKVSTPQYESSRRTKKPSEAQKPSIYEVTTKNNELLVEPLPTLPPNKHFKRPSTPVPETIDKDKIRKRNKIRRRRPFGNNNNNNNNNSNHNNSNKESSTRKYTTSTTEAPEETHTIKPRVRPTQSKPNLTTPTVTTDITTSAIPTISPTNPTLIKKKLIHRRPVTTTTEKPETTTSFKDNETKESPIMKISASSRIHYPKLNPTSQAYRTSETPDYTHKQDEKDTPTSDIAVDTLRTTSKSDIQDFSFHRDTKPLDAKDEIIKDVTTDSYKESSEIINDSTTFTSRIETTTNGAKILRPRLKNKYDRPRFSVKDYRNRLSSTTSTTEKSAEAQTPKLRFPQRRPSSTENKVNDNENVTERKKFTPKDPRHKLNGTEINEQVEKEIHTLRPNRQRVTTEVTEGTTQKLSSRIRNSSRRPKPTDETTETLNPTTVHSKRPLRKKIKDSDIGESVQDISVTESAVDNKNDITSERTRSESAIMKIADKKHHDHAEHVEHSKRVSDLTLAASKDYNTPGMFKSVSANSRRIPNYFTIATDDPILPIEAFFPQLNQKKES